MQINPFASMYSSAASSSQPKQQAAAGAGFNMTDQIVDIPGATPRSALQLAGGGTLLLPTPANAALMAEQAGTLLREKMQKAGMPLSPDFTVQQSGQPPVLKVAGERQDIAAIEAMLNDDPALSRALNNAAAVASMLPELAAASEVSAALQAAGSDAERRAIWDYHQARMASMRSDVRLEMHHGQMTVWVNGEQQVKYS